MRYVPIGIAIVVLVFGVGFILGGQTIIAENPDVKIGFEEPRNWACIADSSKVPLTMSQRFLMNFSKTFPDGRVKIDTVLYVLDFDFEVATSETDKTKNFITREADYRVPVLYINPIELRMSTGQVVNQQSGNGAW